jgi:hypothetical protein
MCCEIIEFFATAPDGDALPFLLGLESADGLKILSIVRTADQIRVRATCEAADCEHLEQMRRLRAAIVVPFPIPPRP